jgi:HEAT repeat protein
MTLRDAQQRRRQGPARIPPAARLLGSSRAASLLFALSLLGCGPSEIDRLLGELKSSDTATRRRAVQALSDPQRRDVRIAGALTGALADPDVEVRRWGCRGLGEQGVTAAQGKLEDQLSDPQESVRRAAAFALQRLVPDSTAYRKELIAAMKSGDGGVVVALASMQPPPMWATDTLVGLLGDRRPGLRRLAVEALGQLGANTREAIAALQRLNQDPDDRVRDAVTVALSRLSK